MYKKNIYLRFLTTYKCNYKCNFCHHEGIYKENHDELDTDKFSYIIKNLKKNGLNKVKFVGGEPLLSKKLEQYLEICKYYDIKNVGITTNGFFTKKIDIIREKFPNTQVTISIPHINELEYSYITKSDGFSNVINTLKSFYNTKDYLTINNVITDLKQLERKFIDHFFDFTDRLKLIVPCNTEFSRYPSDSIQKGITEFFYKINAKKLKTTYNHIQFDYYGKKIEICTPYCPTLCKEVNSEVQTIRITPDGEIKPCLLDNAFNQKIDFINEKRFDEYISGLVNQILPCHVKGTLDEN